MLRFDRDQSALRRITVRWRLMFSRAAHSECIPAHLADEIAEPAAAQEDLERFILQEIENGRPLKGTYPPDEDTLRRAAHRST